MAVRLAAAGAELLRHLWIHVPPGMTGSWRGDMPPVVRLGHDLVRNFEALPPDRAAVEIATHIRKFWEPRMRREPRASAGAT